MNSNIISDGNLPTHWNKNLIFEIWNFHKNIYLEILQKKDNIENDYNYITAKIEDEIFIKYNVEFEEIIAYSKQFGVIDSNSSQIEILNNFSKMFQNFNISINE